MFAINLSGVPKVDDVPNDLHFTQEEVCAVHGHAVLGIQCVVQNDDDRLSLCEMCFPLASCQLGEACSSAHVKREVVLNYQSQ